MKQRLERYQGHMSNAEQDALWKRLRQLPAQMASHHQITGRRWTLSFGTAVAAITVVAVAAALIVRFAHEETNGLTVELLSFGELAGLSRPAGSCQFVAIGAIGSTQDAAQTMPFGSYTGNPFVSSKENPVSTFAVDTDASSYALARRHIENGNLPPMDAVRVEEFLNAFHQGYPPFTSPDFRIYGEGAPSPFGEGYDLLRVGVKARQPRASNRIPISMIFVIDLSDSPADETRLATIKESLRLLVMELTADDRVGIVVSGGGGHTLLEPCGIDQRTEILQAVDSIRLEGDRDVEEAMRLGYAMAESPDRHRADQAIVLCSRGGIRLKEGGIASILDQVDQQADQGRSLTTIDLGMETLNDLLLELLADRGNGRYFYVDTTEEARRIFADNLLDAHRIVASNAHVAVTFDPDRIKQYRLIGFERRATVGDDETTGSARIAAGQEITALYEVKLAEDAVMGPVARVRISYDPPRHDETDVSERQEITEMIEMADMRMDFAEASPHFRLTSTITEFAEILRHSYWARGSRIADLLPIVRRVAGEMEDDPRTIEFACLIERAVELSEGIRPTVTP